MSDSSFGANELDRFRATFFEECAELIADMESRLSCMLTETADSEELNAIFRAVHSIKAGAGAFGLKRLVTFSHTFEALLDWLRDGRIAQDERVATILVKAGDILAALVEAAQQSKEIAADFETEIANELHGLLEEASGGTSTHRAKAEPKSSSESVTPAKATVDYRISFSPHAELFRHANEPLLLIKELERFGTLHTFCDTSKLPSLAAMEPEDAYFSWTFELSTSRSKADIAEVFEFVDQDCILDISESAEEEAFGLFDDDEPKALNEPAPDSSPAAAPTVEHKPAAEPAQKAQSGAKSNANATIRVDLARIDRLVNMVGELVITQAMLAQQIIDQGKDQGQQAIQGHEDLAVLTRELQECVMAIRMQPVKSVFQRMPRLVREVAGKLNKQVNLVTHGEQTEVDKTVIEELADPLTHMIRNSIDHGIETPDVRIAAGKPAEGKIVLSAAHVGSNILIHISDDGAGINRERLLKKAIEKGIVTPNANLSDEEIDELIFAPGFSTAAAVTDVSGRGVGMDVVRRNIVGLGGRIQVQSTFGKGTRFTLIIPLTLAVLDGMIVASGSEKYILPLTSIIESFRPDKSQVREITGGGQVASIRGEYVRLVYLCKIFDVPGAVLEPWKGLVVLVETASGNKLGIVVDELIGQQQVVIKSLLDNFTPVPGISGATILGNGRVALILDIEQLAGMTERRRHATIDGRSSGSKPGLLDDQASQTHSDVDDGGLPRLAVGSR